MDRDLKLRLAAANENKAVVEYLINAGADINSSNPYVNWNVLHYASRNGWLEIVQSLLNKGANIQEKTSCGESPLLLAAENKHKSIVKLLINVGADIHCAGGFDNWTLLHYVSKYGWLNIVHSLLNKGADIQIKTAHGESPLLLAAENKHKSVVELLINVGADVNCSGGVSYKWTLLHCASRNGWLNIVRYLLNKGADIQQKTAHGESPLLLATRNRHESIVKLLINVGADIRCAGGCGNWTLLHYASKYGWLNIVYSLLNKGADIQTKTAHGETPLLLAAKNKHESIVKLLINVGSDINCSHDCDKLTVLHYAVRNGWIDIVQSLLKKGANIDVKSSLGTPLQIAIDNNNTEIVEYLINAGADVNIESLFNKPALSKVIGESPHNTKLVRLLIKSGAYLKSDDYRRIIKDSLLKEHILQDFELCSQAIINEFNRKDLPELYKLSMVRRILPRIENMKISNKSRVAHEVLRSVENEMQVKGLCNVLEVRPKVLKMMSVKSFLDYVKQNVVVLEIEIE